VAIRPAKHPSSCSACPATALSFTGPANWQAYLEWSRCHSAVPAPHISCLGLPATQTLATCLVSQTTMGWLRHRRVTYNRSTPHVVVRVTSGTKRHTQGLLASHTGSLEHTACRRPHIAAQLVLLTQQRVTQASPAVNNSTPSGLSSWPHGCPAPIAHRRPPAQPIPSLTRVPEACL
jgi:hypothetical protein